MRSVKNRRSVQKHEKVQIPKTKSIAILSIWSLAILQLVTTVVSFGWITCFGAFGQSLCRKATFQQYVQSKYFDWFNIFTRVKFCSTQKCVNWDKTNFVTKVRKLQQNQFYTTTSEIVHIKTYWPAGGGRGQNPENTAQGNSGQNAIRP